MANHNDDVVRFVFNWTFDLTGHLSRELSTRTFTTVYGIGLCEWHLSLIDGDAMMFRIGRGRPDNNIRVSIVPSSQTSTLDVTDIVNCHSSVRVIEPLTNGAIVEGEHVSEPIGIEEEYGLYIPRASPMGLTLQHMVTLNEYIGKRCQLSFSLFIKKSGFSNIRMTVPPMLPEQPNGYRFEYLIDKSLHDFTIRCRDGSYTASRQALFLCSPHFRRFFNENPKTVEIVEDASVQAVEIVCTYAMTSTFLRPAIIAKETVKEIEELAVRFTCDAAMRRPLMNAVEKMCIENLAEVSCDIDAVVDWLLVAMKCQFGRLKVAAIALILETSNFANYERSYRNQTMASPRYAAFVALNSRNRFAPSIQTRITQLRSSSTSVNILIT